MSDKPTIIGIILCVITLVCMLFILLFHYFVVEKNKIAYKIFHSYYYWMIIGILLLVYFIVFRWYEKIDYFFKEGKLLKDTYYYSVAYSNTFLLDLCPAVAFLMPLSLIIDKTRNIAKAIAPYALLGSLITIYSTVLLSNPSTTNNDFLTYLKYIFIGEDPNQMFFIFHFYSLMLGIGVLLTTKKFTRYSVLGSFAFICFYIAYVKIFVDLVGVKFNTTGVSQYDWYIPEDENGFPIIYGYSEYGLVYDILKMSFPGIQIFCYSWAVIWQLLIQLFKNLGTINEEKFVKDGFWYSKITFLKINKYLSAYDDRLTNFFKNIFFSIKNYFQQIRNK